MYIKSAAGNTERSSQEREFLSFAACDRSCSITILLEGSLWPRV